MAKFKLPKIGLGTMQGNSKEAKHGFIKGFEIGFRFLDTAQMYFNERVVGEAVKESGIPRDEFIVATKLLVNNLSPRRVVKSTERSLKRLGFDTIDMLYIHWPFRFSKIGEKTLKAMSKLVNQGKIRSIALSNFTPQQVDEAISICDKPIVANQVEMHPWLQQKELVAHHKKKGVYVVPYFPLMHGRFSDVPELVELGKKYSVSGALISLAWLMKKGTVPIPKSINPVHLKANWESQNIKLSSDDMKLIDSIEKEKRFLSPPLIAPKW
ncbi:MAG: aldo/keto reductase [Candidatus Heimdallarchaeota archaeon]|nr:aldo/keto reductase [Candidatus Heimdallarchaeota archaeon]MBY8994368.1 aldo/keto reductase [Candidatus Heimdallarchaeota archaeon]